MNKKSKFKTGPNCELILTSCVEDSGDATLVPRCSQEHPELGEKKLYIIIKFFLFFFRFFLSHIFFPFCLLYLSLTSIFLPLHTHTSSHFVFSATILPPFFSYAHCCVMRVTHFVYIRKFIGYYKEIYLNTPPLKSLFFFSFFGYYN